MTISGSADTMCSEDSICSVLQKLQITINKFQTTFNTQTKRKPQNESVQRTARRSVPPTKRPVLRKQSQLSFSPKGIKEPGVYTSFPRRRSAWTSKSSWQRFKACPKSCPNNRRDNAYCLSILSALGVLDGL